MKKSSIPALVALALLLCLTNPGQAKKKPNFYGSMVMLNGTPLEYDSLPLNSQGIIAMGDPASGKYTRIPFRIYLRRAGAIVRQEESSEATDVYSVQLSSILRIARFGDELVIIPSRVTEQFAKRVIFVNSPNWITTSWFGAKGGC